MPGSEDKKPARVRRAVFPAEAGLVRSLFKEYETSTGQSLCFQGFEEELASLPGKYSEPLGVILLAETTDAAIGCVALRPEPRAGDGACEMKRLYVRASQRGLGAGHLLCEALFTEAEALGYRVMVLDTLPAFASAVRLYEGFGFRERQRYNDDPDPETIFMELRLPR
ncbi:MAG: GNAT family N-acetyltransferase [Planctomycetota bacterium]